MEKKYSKMLHNFIPGGAHTYSRGDDQFPYNAPPILNRGEGAYVYDLNEKKAMTILKQIVKTFDYFVFSKEKYIDGEKFITYQIVPIDQKNILKVKKKDEKYIVSFD